ncbi:hypothetical protein XM38_035350 [Halomicronema hongdechloris C2206]|uniref:DUF4186 domain-containing protein n=1 Tax=Halomicronema hongdechloris C2206 TaxID=1641165 RepID=A0A1Z3HR15_9CYAN|nr:DUF4186 domain-containing protein [Halomicronema hongdechloris]ASC72577.1 hypothetical protein XM38_035350 [Halomicronema hongdechloris C2206]
MDPNLDAVFERLQRSEFRRRFRLLEREREYLQRQGVATILQHGADFIEQRLAPAHPSRDGRQTPWRGHPVFIAQHATGTCCRRCLSRWHGIPPGQALTSTQQQYILRVIEAWLRRQRVSWDQTTD